MEENKIVLYTSNFCSHSWAVERFIDQQEIEVEKRNIGSDPAWREEVMAINNGFASVPTLVFPDGSTLTEPSFGVLKQKLGIESLGLVERLKAVIGR